MFIAYSKADNIRLYALETPQVLIEYSSRFDLYCPYTKCPLVYVRKSKRAKAFFRKSPKASVELSQAFDKYHNGGGESIEHRNVCEDVQEIIYKKYKKDLQSQNAWIDTEYRIGDRVADVVLVWNSKEVQVYEVQFSPITLGDLKDRTQDYLNNGVKKILWLFEESIFFQEMERYLFKMGLPYGIVEYNVNKDYMKLDELEWKE